MPADELQQQRGIEHLLMKDETTAALVHTSVTHAPQ